MLQRGSWHCWCDRRSDEVTRTELVETLSSVLLWRQALSPHLLPTFVSRKAVLSLLLLLLLLPTTFLSRLLLCFTSMSPLSPSLPVIHSIHCLSTTTNFD